MLAVVLGFVLAAGCEKDTDCKGDRVCEAGACVEPRSKSQDPACPEGLLQVFAHCCWPGQTFNRATRRCTGEPTCPARAAIDGERCTLPDGTVLASGMPAQSSTAQSAAPPPSPAAVSPAPPAPAPAAPPGEPPVRRVAQPVPQEAPSLSTPEEKEKLAEQVAVQEAVAEGRAPPPEKPAAEKPAPEKVVELAHSRPFASGTVDVAEGVWGAKAGYLGVFNPGVGVELGLFVNGGLLFGNGRSVAFLMGGPSLGLRFSPAFALSLLAALGPAGINRSSMGWQAMLKLAAGVRVDVRVSERTALFVSYEALPLNGVAHLLSAGVAYQ